MSRERDIKEAIRQIAGRSDGNGLFLVGEVKSVEGESCTVKVAGLELDEVRLTAVNEGADGKLTVTPKVGSMVLMGDMSGGMMRDLAVIGYTQIEKIEGKVEKVAIEADSVELNGGNNGGLINIDTLTQKINALVQAFNSHTHNVATTGTAAAQSGTAAPVMSPAQQLNKSDYEDTKIKH